MSELKQTLKSLLERYKTLQQQQVTFINALKHCHQSALDRIYPVKTLAQVQSYMDSHCKSAVDKQVLQRFLEFCSDLETICYKLCEMHPGDTAKSLLEESLTLLNPSNNFSSLRAKYPHNVLNHLSYDEANNFYGGVVSLIPIVLDKVKAAVKEMDMEVESHRHGSGQQKEQYIETKADQVIKATGVQTTVTQRISDRKGKNTLGSLKPAWRPTGRFYTT